jgi:hypothetical protein
MSEADLLKCIIIIVIIRPATVLGGYQKGGRWRATNNRRFSSLALKEKPYNAHGSPRPK